MSRDMCFPTRWHFHMNRLRRACCNILLSLETPNKVRSVALYSQNIKATSKGSDHTAQADLRLCWSHKTRWKSHVALAQSDLRLATLLENNVAAHIMPGTMVYSDGLSEYVDLNALGYKHFTVMHKFSFKQN